MQIHVEGHEVEEREIEILSGRITRVSDQAFGIGLLDDVSQLCEEPLNPRRAMPTNNIRRDFIADVISRDAGVMSSVIGRLANHATRIGLGSATLQEADVAGPRDVHEDGQAMCIDQIEQPRRGHMVGPDRVCPERLHLRQIIADTAPSGERLTFRIGCERAVGQTSKTSSSLAMSKPLPVNAHSTRTSVRRGTNRRSSCIVQIVVGSDAHAIDSSSIKKISGPTGPAESVIELPSISRSSSRLEVCSSRLSFTELHTVSERIFHLLKMMVRVPND